MNYQYDVTILIPGIRTNRWENLYNSLYLACKKYKWQLLLISPFDLPTELIDKSNIKIIKDYGNVNRCVQLGILQCNAPLFFLTVDDCVFAEDSLDLAIDLYQKQCSDIDVICMRYGEGGNLMAESYWYAYNSDNLRLPGIPKNYKTANQCLMKVETFKKMGGLDCINFEYLDRPIHDFMFRLQKAGGQIYFSPTHVCIATWYETTTGDHAPIHHGGMKDLNMFTSMYIDPNILDKRLILDYDNWKQSPAIWTRRFGDKQLASSYEELCKQMDYKV